MSSVDVDRTPEKFSTSAEDKDVPAVPCAGFESLEPGNANEHHNSKIEPPKDEIASLANGLKSMVSRAFLSPCESV